MEKQERRYTLIVKKQRIEVTEEVYKTYYKLTERERYLEKMADKKHISLENCHQKGLQIDYLLSHPGESLEDSIVEKEMLEKLTLCLETLSEPERLLIYALYFDNKTESALAAELALNQSNISRQKTKILSKLKKLLEI